MTGGAVQDTVLPEDQASVPVGRPPWWLITLAVAVAAGMTADLLRRGRVERMDLRFSEIVDGWELRSSAAYWPIWAVSQLGGRGFIVVVLAGLVVYLAVRRRTLRPLVRVLVAVALLMAVIYGFKYATGRTAPSYPGSFFHRDGASFPSGHVGNAVLMWGVARWQVVEYRLPLPVQRLFWFLSVAGPVLTGVATLALDFHWVTDAVVGGAVGVVLLGVVHLLDATVLSRCVRARAGRPSA